MTSFDSSASASGGSAGRRRALGRGPGAAPPAPESGSLAEKRSPAEAGGTSCPPVPPCGTPAHDAGSGDEAHSPVVPPEAEAAGGGAEGSPAGTSAEAAAGAEVDEEYSPVVPAGAGAGAGADGGGGFKVRLSNFEGPFDLLLQLISKHKLDVTEVALSQVTDEFMGHIRAMGPDWDLDETTEFLVVAATLLDLKAARLLPAAEVEDEADLALLEARDLLFARLLQYRAYKQIAEIFNGRLDDEARRYPRTVGLEPQHAELLPEVVISIGAEGFARLAVKAMQPKPKPQVYVDHIHAPLVSVQEQAQIVVARLRELGEASFRVLVEDIDDTLTVVARFLALLELYREKAVALDQETALGDLTVRWTGGDGGEEPLVTDEFDRPPEPPPLSTPLGRAVPPPEEKT
ncbi:segregation/condensation protein A [Streptomyces sp. TG1A-60]|uniref:segregation and condensation protein A n=1 Tax=Streptomyces sp. TG1A-60 TaxID=3129111 RepID=UPI0030CD5AB0